MIQTRPKRIETDTAQRQVQQPGRHQDTDDEEESGAHRVGLCRGRKTYREFARNTEYTFAAWYGFTPQLAIGKP
jgi:hypothetical protein